MNLRYVRCGKYVCLLLLAVVRFGDSEALGSTQYWPSAGVAWDVNGPWMLQFKETYYYYHEDSDSDHSKSDVSAVYKGEDSIYDIGLGFAYVDGSEKAKQERRPYVFTILRGKILDRDVSNRFMVEYRDLSDSGDYWRFRNKITVNSYYESLDTRGIRLLNRERTRPYVADEVFFNSNGQGFSQNRAYLGMQIKIVENVGADVYYLYQSVQNSDSRWQNDNVIGTDLTITF